jgi:hypothetical protein
VVSAGLAHHQPALLRQPVEAEGGEEHMQEAGVIAVLDVFDIQLRPQAARPPPGVTSNGGAGGAGEASGEQAARPHGAGGGEAVLEEAGSLGP